MRPRGLLVAPIGAVLILAGCDASGQVDPGLLTSVGTIRAKDIAFEPAAITLHAGTPITITFENADSGGIPHGLVVSQGGTQVAAAEIITAPGKTTVEVPPLTAGGYEFSCPVHPNMTGTIVVEP